MGRPRAGVRFTGLGYGRDLAGLGLRPRLGLGLGRFSALLAGIYSKYLKMRIHVSHI